MIRIVNVAFSYFTAGSDSRLAKKTGEIWPHAASKPLMVSALEQKVTE